MSVHGRAIGENHHVPPGHPSNHHVTISRTNQNAASEEEIAGARFVYFKSAAFIEALREHFGKTFGHVLHDQNCGKEVRWNLRQDKLQCVWAASGNSDRNNTARRKRGVSSFFRRSGVLDNGGGAVSRGCARCVPLVFSL